MRGNRVVPAAVLGFVLGLGGCSLLGGDEPAEAPTSGGPQSGPEPTGRPTIPPQLLECDGSTGKPAGGQERDRSEQVDLTDALVASDASWDVPAGFQESDEYYDDMDYEQRMFMHTYVPTAAGYHSLDVLGVLGYTGLDWGQLAAQCGRVPLDAMLDRVAEYQTMLGAQPLDEAQLTEVGPLPAVTQAMRISSYDFRGYWLFSQTELLYLGCQWTTESVRAEMESACTELVSTVRVG